MTTRVTIKVDPVPEWTVLLTKFQYGHEMLPEKLVAGEERVEYIHAGLSLKIHEVRTDSLIPVPETPAA